MPDKHPNILLILTEQHRGDCLGCEGHPVLLTPNMDNIAAHGVRFTSCYSPCPSCVAARRSILSGQSPQRHGLVGYRDGVEWDAPATLPQVLRDAGYQTWFVGRSLHQHPVRKRFGYEGMEISTATDPCDYGEWLRDHAPAGSTGWHGGGVMHNDWTARPWHLAEHLHHTNWTVERALHFLRRRDPACPFFLTVSFLAAHPPLQPPAFYLDRYMRTGVPEPVIGEWCQAPESSPGETAADGVAPSSIHLEGEALLSARAAYYGLINHMDDQLRRIINPITGLTPDNTIILLTSDHGEMLGDHYLWRKSRAYEPSARVPFLLAGPQDLGLGPNTTVDKVASLADLMPTLLDLTGVPVPETVDGSSLAPLARGEDVAWRPFLHIEHAPHDHALSDGCTKFIWHAPTGAEQLFDLTTDPNECRNLAGDADYETALALCRARLVEELGERPEGFTDGKKLIPGQSYPTLLPQGGRPVPFQRRRWR